MESIGKSFIHNLSRPMWVMYKAITIIVILFFISCTIGKKGVFFKEMSKRPSIEINDNKITLNTGNSIQNSSLLIYKIDLSIDTSRKAIELRGFQAIGKDFKKRFELKIHGISKKQLDNYKYFWIDPDKKKTEIEDLIK